MRTLYVAGPVVDPNEVPEVYRTIADWGAARGWEVRLPLLSAETMAMPPENFVKLIAEEIDGSDAVLAVVIEGDQSVPSEITTAAWDAKPQVLVAEQPGRVPRLLRGQPGVIAVVKSDEIGRALGALEDALGGPDARA